MKSSRYRLRFRLPGTALNASVAAEGMTFFPSSSSFASLTTDQVVTFSRTETNRPGAGEVTIQTSETISPDGGQIALPDGGSLVIPAGSLTEPTSFLVVTFEPDRVRGHLAPEEDEAFERLQVTLARPCRRRSCSVAP